MKRPALPTPAAHKGVWSPLPRNSFTKWLEVQFLMSYCCGLNPTLATYYHLFLWEQSVTSQSLSFLTCKMELLRLQLSLAIVSPATYRHRTLHRQYQIKSIRRIISQPHPDHTQTRGRSHSFVTNGCHHCRTPLTYSLLRALPLKGTPNQLQSGRDLEPIPRHCLPSSFPGSKTSYLPCLPTPYVYQVLTKD